MGFNSGFKGLKNIKLSIWSNFVKQKSLELSGADGPKSTCGCSVRRRSKATKHTRRICNTYCFSTATMVARTRLIVTLYVLCLSSFLL